MIAETTDDSLFSQIKDCFVIEAMNWFWFYQMRDNTKGMVRIVAKLKRMLSADVE